MWCRLAFCFPGFTRELAVANDCASHPASGGTDASEKLWERVFKRNLEAAEANGTDVNVELENESPGGELWIQRFLSPYVNKGATAVEIGAGSGRISQWMIGRVDILHLVDYSAYACDILRSKFPTAKVHVISDCTMDGVPDNSADLVYSVSVFGHLLEEQVLTLFSEAHKKLKSGGMLSIHLTDIRKGIGHFIHHTPRKVDTQRTPFRYLHPDYAVAFAEHLGFADAVIEWADNTGAYFLIARKKGCSRSRHDQMREPEQLYAHLKSLGFDPKTVIDVGVAWGTPPLYEAFPRAYLFLFEALPMFEGILQSIVAKRPGQYQVGALSDHVGESTSSSGARTSLRRARAFFMSRRN